MNKRKPTVIDIFAGCGGLSLGLHNAGWRGTFAIEKNDMAFETLRHNLFNKKCNFSWPKWLPLKNHDINQVITKYHKKLRGLRGKVDLVAGGPPCQGFSTEGKRQESDQRNKLIHSYIKFVKLIKPKILLFENVSGFTQIFQKNGDTGKAYSEVVIKKLRKIGYEDVKGKLVDFSRFGVPQERHRFIIIGTLAGNADNFFDLINMKRNDFLHKKGLRTRIGVQAAISDLKFSNGTTDSPDTKGFKAGLYRKEKNNYQRYLRRQVNQVQLPDSHRFVNHRKPTVRVFKKLLRYAEPNKRISGDKRKKYGIKKRNVTVLGKSLRSPTIMSIPDDYIHYSEPRILTVREYARIQSFPDWFEFKGAYTTGGKRRANTVPRYTQIGNAIPPLFAELAGEVLKEMLIGGKTCSK